MAVIVQTAFAQLQPTLEQMPSILELTTLSNHIEILCRCKSTEERMFYILYANKKHLSFKENIQPLHKIYPPHTLHF